MIKSFSCKDTEKLAAGFRVARLANIERAARRKLNMMKAVAFLDDLKVPPANCLKKLSGDRKGQYSIRINDQFRICFEWIDDAAHRVEIVDYH